MSVWFGMAQRLSADDWIRAGLKALAREGFTALKAEALAKKLAVSRGSFYWHFADVAAFEQAVMRRWKDIAADAVIREIETSADPVDRLAHLVRLAFHADPALEAAMRAWSAHEPRARAAVRSVDRRRLGYLEDMLVAAGAAPDQARARAHIIYWTYLGHALSGSRASNAVIEGIAAEFANLVRTGERKRT